VETIGEPGRDWLYAPKLGAKGFANASQKTPDGLLQIAGGSLHVMSTTAKNYMGSNAVSAGGWSNSITGQGGWTNVAYDMTMDTVDMATSLAENIIDLMTALEHILPVTAGPILAIVANVVSWIIRLFMMIFGMQEEEASTGALINSALAKERIRQNRDFWSGIADELETFTSLFKNSDGYSETKTAWLLILQHDLAVNKASAFMGECLSEETWDNDICTKYIKDGMWEVMLPYAQVHIAVLTELQMQFLENPKHDIAYRKEQVEIMVLRTKEVGLQYVSALEHAKEVWTAYRKDALWNPFEEGAYPGWDIYTRTNDFYHPFDFIHARVNRGFNELNIELPVDRETKTYSYDVGQIRDWAYEGCEGERHEDVTKNDDPVEANHACNLYRMITSPNGTDHCRCNAGNIGRKWFDYDLSSSDKQCWANCTNEYQTVELKKLKEVFEDKVVALKADLDKLDLPPTLKIAQQPAGTLCQPRSRLVVSKCVQAMQLAGFSITSKEETSDETRPGGCSLTGDGLLLINDVEIGAASALYAPLCAAMFFDSGQFVGEE
jgi:hypothetical protein